jgi:hypothetical protein
MWKYFLFPRIKDWLNILVKVFGKELFLLWKNLKKNELKSMVSWKKTEKMLFQEEEEKEDDF